MHHSINRILTRSLSQINSGVLVDKFSRQHDYLRISLTERCNLRCKYCMPENGIKLSRQDDYLNLEELKRLSSLFAQKLGVKKIRLTGGEPTIDRKLIPLLEHLAELKNDNYLTTIAMTTNGLTLKRNVALYKKMKLDAVNVSLDTLKSGRFEEITRRKGWNMVMNGIWETLKVNMQLKLNCVIIKGFNDDEILDFVELARENPIEVRFIEFMPFEGNKWDKDKLIPSRNIMDLINSHIGSQLQRVEISKSETSRVYKADGMIGSIGFISSMSDNFCSGCNRLRITSDGNLKVCLFGNEEISLRDRMREGVSDSQLSELIRAALWKKRRQHSGVDNLKEETLRPMIKIAESVSNEQQPDADSTNKFSHVDSEGKAKMVNIGSKGFSVRKAIARGKIWVGREVFEMIHEHKIKKGDVLTVAKIAGIMGAKQTSNLIPLCHNVPLNCINVDINFGDDLESLEVTAMAETNYTTGVEMESLMAVSIAILTLYDMCKSVNKNMVISEIKLLSKSKKELTI